MFTRSLLSRSIAASIALASLPMMAQAQNNQEDALLEEIVVTGIRASLNQAADIKRDALNIVDSVVAEDIGKLPDNNVVESLQRRRSGNRPRNGRDEYLSVVCPMSVPQSTAALCLPVRAGLQLSLICRLPWYHVWT